MTSIESKIKRIENNVKSFGIAIHKDVMPGMPSYGFIGAKHYDEKSYPDGFSAYDFKIAFCYQDHKTFPCELIKEASEKGHKLKSLNEFGKYFKDPDASNGRYVNDSILRKAADILKMPEEEFRKRLGIKDERGLIIVGSQKNEFYEKCTLTHECVHAKDDINSLDGENSWIFERYKNPSEIFTDIRVLIYLNGKANTIYLNKKHHKIIYSSFENYKDCLFEKQQEFLIDFTKKFDEDSEFRRIISNNTGRNKYPAKEKEEIFHAFLHQRIQNLS